MALSTKQKVLVVFIVLFVLGLLALVILGVLGYLGGGGPDETTPSCPNCLFEQDSWKIKTGDYIATRENCGSILVNLAANYLSVKKSEGDAGEELAETVSEFSKILLGMDSNSITLSWEIDKTMRDNETTTLVFSDPGNEYAGCGEYDEAFFKTRPSGETKKQHMLWISEDNPTYLPFYLSRNDADKTICMFADAKGAPIKITVSATATEWLIYRADEVKFYVYNGNSLQEALDKCIEKWDEIYPTSGTAPSWTEDFIIGGLTPGQVKTDLARGTSRIASHYILSPAVLSLGSELTIKDEDPPLEDYTRVFLPVTARQNIDEDSEIVVSKEEGFYPSEKLYTLDFDNSNVKSVIRSNYLEQDAAGFLLSGFLEFPKDDNCPKFFHCSGERSVIDSSSCVSALFGGGRVFEKRNLYDVSMRETLQPTEKVVIETIASPATTHFYRRDLELTEAGVETCYNNILNLKRLGIGAVTCNMCAGVVPSTDDQKSLCFRWSQLALLMPYVIISSDDVDLTDALGESGDDGFSKMKESIALRKQLHYYLAHPGLSMQEKRNAIVIGENMLMIFKRESSSDVTVEFPTGEWLAPNPDLENEGTYHHQEDDSPPTKVLAHEEDVGKLVFYKLGSIFVLKDKDNEDTVQVHIFQLKEGYIGSSTTTTFTYGAHTSDITLDPSSGDVTFEPSDNVSDETKTMFKVSKLVIYNWNKDGIVQPTLVVDFDVEDRKSIFEGWDHSLDDGSGS